MGLTDWYPASIHPFRSGFYELGSGDRLHWDSLTRTWGTWFAEKPGVRFVLQLDPAWRWRGLAEKPSYAPAGTDPHSPISRGLDWVREDFE